MATTTIMTCKDVNYLKQPKKHNNSRHNTTLERVFIPCTSMIHSQSTHKAWCRVILGDEQRHDTQQTITSSKSISMTIKRRLIVNDVIAH